MTNTPTPELPDYVGRVEKRAAEIEAYTSSQPGFFPEAIQHAADLRAFASDRARLVEEVDDLAYERDQQKRTADKAVADLVKWRSAIQALTPGGSEFMDPDAVRDWAQRLKTDTAKARLAQAWAEKHQRAAEAHVERLTGVMTAGQALYDALGNVPVGERALESRAVIAAGTAWVAAREALSLNGGEASPSGDESALVPQEAQHETAVSSGKEG